ncbi:MAG: terminase [Podoviridae sp. ctrTa16]|nr:MAG: terminase [Podoviridae sp. ctrTa16]
MDLQKETVHSLLYTELDGYISQTVVKNKNRRGLWRYGYNPQYDMVIISKTGKIGKIISISGLRIALPEEPEQCLQRHSSKAEQYWEREIVPKEMLRVKSIHQWNSMPKEFKERWIDYIDSQYERRENGLYFMNNGVKTYITGGHWMYLSHSSIDIGYPDYREANRIFFIFWEACKADERCYGIIYLKIRRSGFSFMCSSEIVNTATLMKDARLGILSKTGTDAKKMFTDKVVNINDKLPFFFKPIMDGMNKPKTELSYRIPAVKITRKNMYNVDDGGMVGLNTTIDWRNTEENSYDGEKLRFLAHDESSKWIPPNNILNNWRVTKTCLRLGAKIVGKCMMGSTANALNKGGGNYKKLYEESNPTKRNANGQTKSGLYSLFIPMEWNMEGFIDRYGMPVFRKPKVPVVGIDGGLITNGAIDFWEAEVESLKSDPDALNEFYRQYPRTTSHAFRDESKQSIMNLTKIYEQIDYNDSTIPEHYISRGNFYWKDGILDSEVIWSPDPRGRFHTSWIPPVHMRNKNIIRSGIKYPLNEHVGAFGCDSYDISATVDGRGSNGALHGLTKFSMDEAPSNEFFLEYISRPQTAEIFYEDVLMAIVFYGMPVLAENNKPRLLYHLKNRGYRGFSMNRPDKHQTKLSKTELEIGGIPNTSEDVKQIHAAAIQTYIEKYVGYDTEGKYREQGVIGIMPFNRTLEDWARFDVNNRTKHDASISSGLAIMANQKTLYLPDKKQTKITVNFARYSNIGNQSTLIR